MSGSGWDEPPGASVSVRFQKSPLLIVTTNPWGGVISTSHQLNIVERVDILSAARLAVGMVGMRRAIRGTPNLSLDAPGLLHSDEFSWPHDRDAQVRVTRFSIPGIYILISCLFMFLQSTDLSIKHLACINFLDTIIPKIEVTPPMTSF
jgi:hypothetical protein